MENHSVISGKFTCPKDFTEVINTEGLCLEDIDDDSEIFIIQAPADADLTKLHHQQLHLREPTNIYYPSEGSQEEVYKCTVVDADRQLSKACVVLPERSSLKLCAAEKHIEGIVYLEKRMPFPQIGCPKELCSKIKGLENLKKRADSLSSEGNSTVLSDDYDKKKTLKESAKDLSRADDHSFQSVRKKHSRHLIQDAVPSEEIAVKNKKKHSHSKVLSGGECSDASLGGAECRTKTYRNADPEHLDVQMSPDDIATYKHLASTKKKKKCFGDYTSHEAEESELSQTVDETGVHEHSPIKPHKKKKKPNTPDSSFTSPHLVENSQENRKPGKTKHKKDKLKELSSEESYNNPSSSTYMSSFKFKEETDDYPMEENSSFMSFPNGTSCGELLTDHEKSKKKKKDEVSYEDKTLNSSCTDPSLIEDSEGGRKPGKTKHKKDKLKELSSEESYNNPSSSAYMSSFKIKEEKNSSITSFPNGTSCGELPTDQKKSKKKKKDEVSYEDKTLSSSYTDPSLIENSQGDRKPGKTKHKKDKLKELSSEESYSNPSRSAYMSSFKIKEEMDDYPMEENSSFTSFPNGTSCGELPLDKKKSKKKKKDEVSYEDKTLNPSYTDPSLIKDSQGSRKHGKAKHKKDKLKELSSEESHNYPSTSAHVSSYKIKEEVEDNVVEENSSHMSCPGGSSYGELPFDKKKSKKKKKKKDESDS